MPDGYEQKPTAKGDIASWTPADSFPRYDDDGLKVDEHCKLRLTPEAAEERGKDYTWMWRHSNKPGWRFRTASVTAYDTAHGSATPGGWTAWKQPDSCPDCAARKSPEELADSYWYVGGTGRRFWALSDVLDWRNGTVCVTEGQTDAEAVAAYYAETALTHCRAVNGPTWEQAARFNGYLGAVLLFADRDDNLAGLRAARKTLDKLLRHRNGRPRLSKEQVTVVLPPVGFKDIRDYLEHPATGFKPLPDAVLDDSEATFDDLEFIPASQFTPFFDRAIRDWNKSQLAKRKDEFVNMSDAKKQHYRDLQKLLNEAQREYPINAGVMDAKGNENEEFSFLAFVNCINYAGRIAVDQGRRLHHYKDGLWRPDGNYEVMDRARLLLGEYFKTDELNRAVKYFEVQRPELTDRTVNTDYINCLNGLLNWRTGEFIDHTPDIYVPNQIPVEWNPEAECPAFDKWLLEVVPADAIEFLFEVIGYALLNENPLQKCVGLIGEGSNGKGAFLRLLRKLLGADNVSGVPLEVMVKNTFASADLQGKLANIVGDSSSKYLEDTALFKMLTGQDAVRAERKNQPAFEFVCRALLMMSYNQFPKTSDHTPGFYRRWIFIPFIGNFEGKADSSIEEKISTPAELQGILAKAVMALRNLTSRDRFDEPESVKAKTKEFRTNTDAIRAFVDAAITVKGDEWVSRAEIHERYTAYMRHDGGKPVSTRGGFWDRFKVAFRDLYGGDLESMAKRISGADGYRGLTLRGDFEGGFVPRQLVDE